MQLTSYLSLGRETNKTFAIFGEGNNGGRCPSTFGVLNYPWGFTFHDWNTAVCRSQVNTDNLALDLLTS